MKKYEIVIVICVVIGIFIGFLSMFKENKRIEQDYLNSEFKLEVEYVNYQDKNNCIHFTNGTVYPYNINLFDPKLRNYQGKEFKEFIFPGDSIFKYKNEVWLLIKPIDGRESFKIW